MKKIIKPVSLLITLLLLLTSCTGKSNQTSETSTNSDTSSSETPVSEKQNGESATDTEHTKILFTMENGNTFTIELYPEYAPETCANFKKLVNEGFYNGLTFHRVVEGFMAQGGDPDGTGSGGSPDKIKGEFSSNGFTQNTLSHKRGVVSMARTSNDNNSASSQFFICYADCDFLDGDYAAFGKVVDGMDTVDAFLDVERVYSNNELSKPTTPIVIKTAEVIK